MGVAPAFGDPVGQDAAGGDADAGVGFEQFADAGVVLGKFDEPSADGVAVVVFKAVIQAAFVAVGPFIFAEEQTQHDGGAFVGVLGAVGVQAVFCGHVREAVAGAMGEQVQHVAFGVNSVGQLFHKSGGDG